MIEGGVRIERIEAEGYTFPLDDAESDGTLRWDSVSLLLVTLHGGGETGIGYSYTSPDAAGLVTHHLQRAVVGSSALSPEACWYAMLRDVRNLGREGVVANAISAVDVALWDLKARILDLPLVDLLGAVRDEIAVYGSGGFTSLDVTSLRSQLEEWADQGLMRVKMKVGREPDEDVSRVAAVREGVGADIDIFVDANGAYSHKQALEMAERFAAHGVTWFEEPVSSDDLEGLRLVRERGPAGMAVSAGEYGYDPWYFRRMLQAGSVDVLQADVTRCLGVTGFLKAAALAEAFQIPLSSHTAPALHVHLGCALRQQVHAEWFYDHALIESILFEGTPRLIGGAMRPDRSAPGLGLVIKRGDAERFAA